MPPKKLIEVALPLDVINEASAKEKSIRHGHPSTLHLWWSRKPLATSRAILFAQLVDDPSAHPERFPTLEAQQDERRRLFDIIGGLVQWRRRDDPEVLAAARQAILDSCGGQAPTVLDPFCGGGSIPFEAQRLGLRAFGSDLNPVAVLITRGLVEFPQRFVGRRSVTGAVEGGAQGLAADLEHYGARLAASAAARLSHLYPMVDTEGGPTEAVAWLWARTVSCANPACRVEIPLTSKWKIFANKRRKVWVSATSPGVGRAVETRLRRSGTAPAGTVSRRGAVCLACSKVSSLKHLRSEAQAGHMGVRLLAVVGQRGGEKVFFEPSAAQRDAANNAEPAWQPNRPLQGKCRVSVPLYGLETFADLFTERQLQALETFSSAIVAIRDEIRSDALGAGFEDDGVRLTDGGQGADAYADAVVTYLAFALDKCADYWNTLATWMPRGTVSHAFTRQALAMSWDFAEANPLSDFHCSWSSALGWVARQVRNAPDGVPQAQAARRSAVEASVPGGVRPVISTDPPYYDNILYSDLSDFFYVWLRRTLRTVFPELFRTALTPRQGELVMTHFRHGGDRQRAHEAFQQGLGQAFSRLREIGHPDHPMTVYYAFKQTKERRLESGGTATSSTGWDAMLSGLVSSGLAITGTWPVRSERSARSVAQGANAMASSIVLVCRPRAEGARTLTRRSFIRALRAEMPAAVTALQSGGVQPVDLAQAAIGPGMALFSRGARVLEPDGAEMSVRTALELINKVLDELLGGGVSFDPETSWAAIWFEMYGMEAGPFGEAQTLVRAKNTTLESLSRLGIAQSQEGEVRLQMEGALTSTVWGCLAALLRAFEEGGSSAAGVALAGLPEEGREALALAWRLHSVCERKGMSGAAGTYNRFVTAWPEILRQALGPSQSAS